MEEWILFLFYKDKKNNINNKGKMCKIKALKDIFPYIKYKHRRELRSDNRNSRP